MVTCQHQFLKFVQLVPLKSTQKKRKLSVLKVSNSTLFAALVCPACTVMKMLFHCVMLSVRNLYLVLAHSIAGQLTFKTFTLLSWTQHVASTQKLSLHLMQLVYQVQNISVTIITIQTCLKQKNWLAKSWIVLLKLMNCARVCLYSFRHMKLLQRLVSLQNPLLNIMVPSNHWQRL